MQIETVKIKSDSERGWVIINKSDFDEKNQTLWQEAKPKAKPKKKAVVKK